MVTIILGISYIPILLLCDWLLTRAIKKQVLQAELAKIPEEEWEEVVIAYHVLKRLRAGGHDWRKVWV